MDRGIEQQILRNMREEERQAADREAAEARAAQRAQQSAGHK